MGWEARVKRSSRKETKYRCSVQKGDGYVRRGGRKGSAAKANAGLPRENRVWRCRTDLVVGGKQQRRSSSSSSRSSRSREETAPTAPGAPGAAAAAAAPCALRRGPGGLRWRYEAATVEEAAAGKQPRASCSWRAEQNRGELRIPHQSSSRLRLREPTNVRAAPGVWRPTPGLARSFQRDRRAREKVLQPMRCADMKWVEYNWSSVKQTFQTGKSPWIFPWVFPWTEIQQ